LTIKRHDADDLCSATVISEAAIFVGEFVASGLAAFSCLVGGGVGQEGVAAGCPAGSGEGEGADDQGGVVVGVVGSADGSVFGSGVVGAPVDDAGLAEVGEAE
jgi:hypothetical protein